MIAPRLLVVVAHPDDETFGCGSVLLHAAARGATTAVCCATRGEEGEPAPGSGITSERLAEVRERELRQAATAMGVDEVELLAFRDSGMGGQPRDGALLSVPLDAVARAVGDVIERTRPHVVVTLDAADGHRDHARIRDATLAAVERCTWQVQRVYLQCLPRSLLRRWAAHMRFQQPDSPYLDVDGAGLGTPDALVTTVIDVAAHLQGRRAAIALHASQTSPFASLPEDLVRDFLATDHLQRVVPPSAGGERETDLFAGIALDRDSEEAAGRL